MQLGLHRLLLIDHEKANEDTNEPLQGVQDQVICQFKSIASEILLEWSIGHKKANYLVTEPLQDV